jgi:3-hydroxymyristoyl/3-hydroxydecanoyl-(acyl carrier protein) dehydratase
VTLPVIDTIECDGETAHVRFDLSPDLDVFQGHFPDMPILPGVAQLDWVMQIAARCFGLTEPVARDFQVKFTDIIRPGSLLSLDLDIDRTRSRLSFQYKVGEKVVSAGRIKLENSP